MTLIRPRAFRFAAAALGAVAVARAQTIEELRQQLRDNLEEVKFLSSLVLLSDELELSGAHYRIDDEANTELWSLSIPWHSKAPVFGDDAPLLYFEGAVGYAEAHESAADVFQGTLPGLETSIRTRWRTYGIVAGAGPQFDVADDLTVTTIANAGVSRIENDTNYGGPGASFVASFADGIAFNWDAMAFIYGGALRADWRHPLGDKHLLEIVGRYDLRWTDMFATDDPAQDFTSRFQLMTVRTDLTGPTGTTLFDKDLSWQATVAYRQFVEGDLFDVEGYTTVGGALLLDTSDGVPLARSASVSAYGSFGDDFVGWTIGVSLSF